MCIDIYICIYLEKEHLWIRDEIKGIRKKGTKWTKRRCKLGPADVRVKVMSDWEKSIECWKTHRRDRFATQTPNPHREEIGN